MKTKREFLQDITRRYRASGEAWPATAKHIASWAIREGLWKPQSKSMISQAAMEIAAAMREEYYTDAQGRRVRKKHPFREVNELLDGTKEQLFLWIDISDANHEQAELAFQYGRKLVLGDCRQLKTDVDSYNDNNKNGGYIEVAFDFTDDLAELEQPVEYPGL